MSWCFFLEESNSFKSKLWRKLEWETHWPFCTGLYKYKFVYLLLILHIKTQSHHLEPINLMEICQTGTLEGNSGHRLKKYVRRIDFYFKIGELLIKMLFHNLSSLQITNGKLWEVCLTWQIADLSFCWLLIWLHGDFPFPFPFWHLGYRGAFSSGCHQSDPACGSPKNHSWSWEWRAGAELSFSCAGNLSVGFHSIFQPRNLLVGRDIQEVPCENRLFVQRKGRSEIVVMVMPLSIQILSICCYPNKNAN